MVVDKAATHTLVDTNFALLNKMVFAAATDMHQISKVDVIGKELNGVNSTISINYVMEGTIIMNQGSKVVCQ